MLDLLIRNIGTVVSGNLHTGILEGKQEIAVSKGLIAGIGAGGDFDAADFRNVVDAAGQTAVPGFLDAHVHNGMEDYNACLQTAGLFEEALLNGTTTMVSEGEQGPGYPRFFEDTEGIKAQTVTANRIFKNFRPGGGLKLHAGALVLTDGLTEADFAELAEKGIWLVAEIGGGGTSHMPTVLEKVVWAKKHSFFVSVHLAPPSIPGSAWLHAGDVVAIQPHKVAHVNGGTTSSPWEEIEEVIASTRAGIELIPAGNIPKFIKTVDCLRRRGELDRIVFGSDAPTGACALPGAMNRAILMAASLCGVPGHQAIAMATGNTARLYGLPVGEIAIGREADIVIIDAPPGCEGQDALGAIEMGDLFGCSLVMVDGRVVATRGRDTRATSRTCTLNGVSLAPQSTYEFLYRPRGMPGG